MGQYVLLLVVALTVGAVVFGVTVLVSGGDPGLDIAEPDGRAVPLPGTRPLAESDVAGVRFDTAVRGYRMAQVDQALRRAAYDIGYKDELISVLEAEITALREGRIGDADVLRDARLAAMTPAANAVPPGAAMVTGPGAPAAEATVIDMGLVTEARSEPTSRPDPEPPARSDARSEPSARSEPPARSEPSARSEPPGRPEPDARLEPAAKPAAATTAAPASATTAATTAAPAPATAAVPTAAPATTPAPGSPGAPGEPERSGKSQ